MYTHKEIDNYSAQDVLSKEAVLDEIEKLQGSLPFYFFSVKYNYLLFFTYLSKRTNRKNSKIPFYICTIGLFTVIMDNGDQFIYLYKDKKWFFTSKIYGENDKVEIVDGAYINSLNRSFSKIYRARFIMPKIFSFGGKGQTDGQSI